MRATGSSVAERELPPNLQTSLTKNRSHQDLPACPLLPHPSSGHFPQQVALIFMLAQSAAAFADGPSDPVAAPGGCPCL